MIRISQPTVPESAHAVVLQLLKDGQLAQGKFVQQFEESFARAHNSRHGIAVTNGTHALLLALQSMRLDPGAEVLTTPFTFAATANAILEAGLTVSFCDIDLDTFLISPNSISNQLTDKTQAVLPVHLYGQMSDMKAIVNTATQHGIGVLEDAAQAHGASRDGISPGQLSRATFSFYATKNMASGEGGMILVNEDDEAQTLRLLRNQGMRGRYEYETVGMNYRLTELQAALLLPQLDSLSDITRQRNRNANLLSEGLKDCEGIITPVIVPDSTHAFHQYTIRIDAGAPLSRNGLQKTLAEKEIESVVYYPQPLNKLPHLLSHPNVRLGSTPNAFVAAESVLSLPVHPGLNESHIDQIISAIKSMY